MKVKILRKLQEQIRVREEDGEFILERRSISGEWGELSKSRRIEKVLLKKHNYWYSELSRLNYSVKLLNRRKMREKKKNKMK